MSFAYRLACLAAVATLAACARDNNVSITRGTPTVQTQARSEPVFYNGKTYRLDYAFNDASQSFDLKVNGMGAKQQKDAAALASSALGHFACPSSKPARLLAAPSYAGGVWSVAGRCG
ncbi:MAG: hypothetical protein HY245_07175 [Rhizobiales bacterium]|nr:hypothetical protein [Hyphomicrobiales bacterium]MBI3673185.1 hypothetical protein [Hyphomicrobiales bacterium]